MAIETRVMPVNPGTHPAVPMPPQDRSFTLSQAIARATSRAFRGSLNTTFHILRGTRGR